MWDDKTPASEEVTKLGSTDGAPEHEYLHGYKLWVVTVYTRFLSYAIYAIF
jgi:hypothetical protein